MLRKVARLIALLGVTGLAAWLARLRAHGKVPAPEGRWRELSRADLE